MNAIFTNSGNSKASDPHRLLLSLFDKINIKRKYKYVALSNLSMYYRRKDIKNSYKNIKFKVSSLRRNEKFELLDGTQNYIEYTWKTWRKD